jgi:glycosyltransferase involved in cell wall biosynthesis
LKLRLLYIVPGFAENEQDTSCIPALQELALALKSVGLELKIIALHYPQKAEYTWNGIPIKSFGKGNPRGLKRLSILTLFKNKIREEVKQFQPDVIHGFWLTDAGWLAALMGKELGIPTVLTAMGQDVSPTFYTKRIRKWKTPVVAISEFQERFLRKLGVQLISTIPHGITKPTTSFTSINYDVVSVGSLIPVKNPELALKSFHELITNGHNVRMAFIGDGPLKDELISLAKQLNVSSKVDFLGHLDRDSALQHMSQASILLHTAQFEGYGMVLAEAEALGLHIVSTPVGIAPDIAKSHLFKTQEECVAQLKNCLKTTSTPSISFSIQQTTQAYLELYTSLLKS